MRGLYLRRSKATNVLIALIIGKDDDEVGIGGEGREGEKGEEKAKEKSFMHRGVFRLGFGLLH